MMQPSEDQERRLRELVQIFLQENSKINLSAFRTEEDCWTGNILDSVAGCELLRLQNSDFRHGTSDVREDKKKLKSHISYLKSPITLLDIGTGGGFPLLPIAILHPDWSCTGIDSTRKKIDAIGRIMKAMDIRNVELKWGRCEELKRSPAYRGQFDVVTARAVAKLPELIPLMSPFAKEGGVLLCWKSLHCDEEITDAQKVCDRLGCTLIAQERYDLERKDPSDPRSMDSRKDPSDPRSMDSRKDPSDPRSMDSRKDPSDPRSMDSRKDPSDPHSWGERQILVYRKD